MSSDQSEVLTPTPVYPADKAGTDVFLLNGARSSTNIGITILPVRINRLEDFGTVEQVADRLIQAEKAKEGQLFVELVSTNVHQEGDTTFYDIEYDVDGTRGKKRFATRVAILDRKLFIANGQYKCGKGGESSCTEPQENVEGINAMRDIVQSFTLVPA